MKFFGEELVIKMWESLVDKGIGGILQPLQEKRMGQARLEQRKKELLEIAQTEQQIKKIAAGEAFINKDGKFLLLHHDKECSFDEQARSEPQLGDLNIYQRAASAQTSKMLQKEVNVAKTIMKAEEMLSESEAEATDKKVEQDWIFTWRDNVERVSSEEMQNLWARVLTEEVKLPGSFSMRTLDFLKSLTRSEAETIERIAPLITQHFITGKANDYKETHGIHFGEFLKLQDLGLLSGVDGLGLSYTFTSADKNSFKRHIVCGELVITISDPDPQKKFIIDVISVTELGKQVFKLSQAKKCINTINKLAKIIVEKNVETVTIAELINRDDGQYLINEKIITK